MVKCWVHSCKHYNVRETCRFFSFPLEDKKREHWLELLRYDKEPGPGARICSCHFEGGVKENGPSIFAHNNETFIPHHLSPETRTSRIAEIAMEDIPSTSTDEPYPIESVVLDAHADSDVLFKVECEESDLLEHSENADVTMQAHENDKLNATSNIYIKREIEEAEIITDPEPTENMINIKNEYIDSDDMDDNVLSSEGTSKVDEIVLKNEIDEFEACDTDNIKTEFSGEIRDNRINYEVKIDDEIDASDVSNKFLSCGNCMVTYQDYCTKCDMLVCILNGNTSSNKDSTAIEDIPKDILEIRKSLASFGTFALKVIPEGVRFGPFFGSNTSESSWRIKGGKFLVAEDKSKLLNWMQYINPARNILERNLAVLQHESNLYYRTIREIQEGEELLVYFGEEYEGSLINDVEVEFVPTNVKDIEDAFVCTFCCLGFSSMIYLVNHKTICPYRITGGSLKNEIVQCPNCKLYLEQGEYIDYHIACCREKSAGQFPSFSPRDQMIISPEDQRQRRIIHKCSQCKYETLYKCELKNHTNKHYGVKVYRCRNCGERFNRKESLKRHLIKEHMIIEKKEIFKCLFCEYSSKQKSYWKAHLEREHLKQGLHKCIKCKYDTTYISSLKDHLFFHDTEKRFKCPKWKYKSNYKKEPLKRFKCSQCDYVAINQCNLQKHFLMHEIVKAFKCLKCNYKTSIKNKFIRHLNSHESVKHLKSSLSDYVTNHQSNLKKHFVRHKINRFKCSHCDYWTNNMVYFKMHVDSHKTVKRFTCSKCDYATNSKGNLNKHSRMHDGIKQFKCSKCDYCTNYKCNLVRHLNTHECVKQLKCLQCDYVTNNKSSFKVHSDKHNMIKRFKCSDCDYVTYRKVYLKRHSYKHDSLKRLKCTQCDYETPRREALERHFGTHEIVKRFKCAKCDYATNDKGCLKRHANIHEIIKRFKCSDCNYATNDKNCLKKHSYTHKTVKQFKCSQCDFGTNYKSCLAKHFLTHELTERFECSQCEYTTKYQNCLKQHASRHEKMKRFKCSDCDYITDVKMYLKKHCGEHNAVKRFHCSKCDYATNDKSYFKRHSYTHETVKRFKCLHCDYATNDRSNLKKHSYKHEAVKRFKCSQCDYYTNNKTNLERHLDTHDSVKRLKCS